MNAHGRIAATVPGPKLLEFPRPSQPTSRLLVPREHGSWGIWLLPLIGGAVVGYVSSPRAVAVPALWFLLAAVSAFLVYQPLEILLGLSLLRARSQRQERIAILWIMALCIMAACSVLELIRLQRVLVLLFGLVALLCFGLRTLLGRSRTLRVPKQLIGALGLSSTAAGAYYATTGRIDRAAIVLWLASWLFAVSQIEYVQLRLRMAQVRSRRQKARDSLEVCFLHLLMTGGAVAAGLAGAAPLLLGLAFIPAMVRLAAWIARPWRPLGVHILGFTELFQGILFNVLLAAAFLVHF
jgi:YwiC-like protein